MFPLPLIFVFSFDPSLSASLPPAAAGTGDEAEMLLFAPAEEEEISITPEGQGDKNSLHMASFQHIPANNKNMGKKNMKCRENSTPSEQDLTSSSSGGNRTLTCGNKCWWLRAKEAVYVKQELVSNVRKASSISLFYGRFKEPPLMLP